jgi:4-oxalocrotonate tautomerase
MPLIQVNLKSGRSPEQLHTLQLEIHEAVKRALPDATDPAIRVLLYEIPAEHWMAGGITLAEKERPENAAP